MATPEDDKSGRKETGEAAGRPSAGPESSAEFTAEGAPTDEAHQAVGDGTLTGSAPAGLTVDELLERAATSQSDNPGSE
jgi:hypothetical protein